jgi:gas vesicle protein
MNLERELYELLETVQGHLPSQMHKVYEQAVDRALHRHSSRRGGGWWRREQRQEEVSVSVFALIIGLIGGAALMYLFDPERGERRRALLQIRLEDALSEAGSSIGETAQRVKTEVEQAVDEAVDSVKETTEQVRGDVEKAIDSAADTTKVEAAKLDKAVDNTLDSAKSTANNIGQAVSGVAKDAANKVKSAADEVKQQVENAATSDQTLTTRVRTTVAGAVRAPGSIQVEVKNGEVTLTGTIPAGEVQSLVEKIQALPGVSKVDNRLEVHDAAQT